MMKPHLRYLWYVLKHKWRVFVWCCRLGIPLQGITHDLSKFSPDEWGPYVDKFYRANEGEVLEAMAKFGAEALIPFGYLTEDRFMVGVHHHYNKNPHHPEYWQGRNSAGRYTAVGPYDMPLHYRKEMLADWLAVGGGYEGAREWYQKHGHKKPLHPKTRTWVEKRLGIELGQ